MPRLEVQHPEDQLALWDDHAHDWRGVYPTGWDELDGYLYRGGLAPGELVLLGGRTGTRKTTVVLNLIVGFLRGGRSVGLVGLDEAPFTYVAKLASAISGRPHQTLEEDWDCPAAKKVRQQYLDLTEGQFTMAKGYRPGLADLTEWREMASVAARGRMPDIVVIDYLALLARENYPWRDVDRIPRLAEDLKVWTNEHEVVTIALHQVGRVEDGGGTRYHGDKPMTQEQLKYGGEEIADLVLATFRPAKDPLGNMSFSEAEALLGDRFDEDKYAHAVQRVRKFQRSTFLQVLKNRPGTRTCERGIELLSPSTAMLLHPAGQAVNDDMQLREEP